MGTVVISKIYMVRGMKLMPDEELAGHFYVKTKRLNEQVNRNFSRSPKEFMFRLPDKEFGNLKSHMAASGFTTSIS
jgi:hypothetical protein